VGTIATGAMLGSALLTLFVGLWVHKLSRRVLLLFAVYRRLSSTIEALDSPPSVPLGPSHQRVYRLAALFSLDAFAGGFVLNTP
jgi:hypothetical protein